MRNPIEWVRGHFNRDGAIVAGALAFGALALYIANSYLEHQEAQFRATLTREHKASTTDVVVAAMDLPAGSEINSDTVAVRSMPSDYVYGDAVRPSRFDSVKGRRIDRKLEKGRPLLFAFVSDGLKGFSDGIQTGRRALTLNVDEVSSINGLVRPGDKLDLIVTSRSTGQAVVRPLLLGVKVLATGSLTSASTPPEGRPSANLGLSYSTITLEVSPREAEQVILARDTGQVTAMLRRRTGNEPDEQLAAIPDASPAAAPYKASTPGRRSEIDYILGGRGDGMPQYVRVPVDMAAYVAGGGAEPRVQLPPQQRQQSATPTVAMPKINVTTKPGALPSADMPPGASVQDATPGVPGLVNREAK